MYPAASFRCLMAVLFSVLILSAELSAQQMKNPPREDIEWLDVWMPFTNDSTLPRILLIGNSITRGYYPEVQKLLTGKAYVARLTTSKSVGDPGLLKEVSLVMSYYKFDIVHFNNGLHGWKYSEKEYEKAFPDLVKTIRKNAPSAKLIWATTTPVRVKGEISSLDPKTERIKERNRIALAFISKQKDIGVDDLWAATISKPEYFQGGDGTHPNPSGYQALAQTVTAALNSLLEEKQ
jgi:hypothetical protein